MNSIKERIDEIHNGSVKAIMDGITSSSPIEFLNAMIFGTRLGIDNSRGISVQTLCESCYSLRIELHRKRVQRPVAQLGMRYSGEQL